MGLAMRWLGARYYLEALDGWSIAVWLGGVVGVLAGWRVFAWALPSLGLFAAGGAVAVPRREGLEPAAATRRHANSVVGSCR